MKKLSKNQRRATYHASPDQRYFIQTEQPSQSGINFVKTAFRTSETTKKSAPSLTQSEYKMKSISKWNLTNSNVKHIAPSTQNS